MSHIDHLQNYYSDLFKAQHTPLLIELSHADINALTQDQQATAPLSLAKSVFDRDLKNQTSIVLLDGDDAHVDDQFFLLDQLLEQLRSELKEIKNLAVLKESLKGAASVATGGMLGDLLSNHLDNGLSFILDEIGGEFSSLFSKVVLDNVGVSEQLLSNAEGILHDCSSETLGDLIANISKQNLFLSIGAKSELNRLSNQFSASENIDLFQLAFKLLLAIAIDSPKLIYINNPHRLDSSSIAILSLLFSYAKNQKEQDQHIGLSVVYTYSDPSFDLYQEVAPELTIKQQLLSDQRRFVQRYAMLERPSSDIPNLAVKSSLFIGRQEELHTLNRQYVTRVPTTLSVIAGEPGIGKTALVNQHIKTITKSSPAIVLTLLNEVGHSSSNTGLSSLEKSIIEEEKRLHHHRNFKEKTLGFLRNLHSKETVFNAAGLLLSGADKALNIIDAGYQRIQTDGNLNRLQDMGMQSLDNKQQDEKERQFNKLDTAITLLTKIHSEPLPIILFIDDLQWIDDTASEYILTRLLKRSDIYVVATLRPSDAATQYKAWQSNLQLHRHALSLLTAAKVTGAHEFSQSPEAGQLPDCSVLHVNTLTLSGFDKHALTQLIAKVISGTHQQHHQLAEAIVSTLGNGSSTEVNTLFAVETINMLCDAKLYRENRFEQLILSAPLRFNPDISDINDTLKQTFESLQRKYQDSLVHASQTGAHQGFNLMAYAVLEERLHLLKIYFGEMGNAAVNTLLFSSLLGAPFSSELVKCVLNALSTTNEPKLQSLKSHITQNQKQVNLQPEHYAIIDEVYEILRRLATHDDQYQYSHGLLHIFLDKQFDYLLDSQLPDANQVSKDALILLISATVDSQLKALAFFNHPFQALTQEQTTSLIFHKTVIMNVHAKGYLYHPDRWAPQYASSLYNLAISYQQNNDLDKAISLQRQCSVIALHYYQKDSDPWVSALTKSLSNLGSLFQRNNKLERAISYQETTCELLLRYYEHIPDFWAREYAASLSSLASSYQQNNQLDKAICLQEKSIKIYKEYRQPNSEEWPRDYARSLHDLASSYKQNNELEKALNYQERSLKICKHYYLQDPDQWAYNYTSSLCNLALLYTRINQLGNAIALEEQSLEINKHYYQNNPEYWAQSYANSLNNLACSYQRTDQLEKAIDCYEQSLEIVQHYYQQNPDQWAEDYTIRLNNLAHSYVHNNQLEKAIVFEEQSLAIRQRYYQNNPKQWAQHYATSLNNLAGSYAKANQLERAIDFFEQSLEIVEHYYQQNPDQWAKDYTISLNNLAGSYKQNNQLEKAITLREQALEIAQRYFQQSFVIGQHYNPKYISQWAENYTTILDNLTTSYTQNNQLEKAITLYEQFLEICECCYQQNPEQWRERYVRVLNYLAVYKEEQYSYEESLALAHKALDIYKDIIEQEPSRWLSGFLSSLDLVASNHLRLQHYADASHYYNDYFNCYSYQEIESVEDVTYFIYPMVKYVQATRQNHDNSLYNFVTMVDDFSSFMTTRFGALYKELLAAEQAAYSALADSGDPLDRDKYHIFMEFFAVDASV
ncbi:tetratricopeptide repeat protein [Vibrio sp. PNB23_22_6]